MKRRVVVIGAGLAGLRAGWELANAGHAVTVLERKSIAGGRAGSAPDPETREPVDTGQHAFMGCYTRTLDWFAALGTKDRLWFDDGLDVGYMESGGGYRAVRASALPAPFHLLTAIGRLEGGWRACWPLSKALRSTAPDDITVREWEDRLGFSDDVRRLLIEPLALAALNEDPAVASALPLVKSLRIISSAGLAGSALGFATRGLGDLYVPGATKVIEHAGGSVRTGAWAARLIVSEGRARGITLQDGTALEADAVVSALAPSDLVSLLQDVDELSDLAVNASKWQSSPILTVHLWLDRPVIAGRFVGLLDGAFDWVFDRTKIVGGSAAGEHQVALVKSGARSLLGRKPDELNALATTELRRFLPASRPAKVIRSRPVWETKATVSLAPGTDALRPGPVTPVRGFFLAGDWTQTGLPATIESAVASGMTAARNVLSRVLE